MEDESEEDEEDEDETDDEEEQEKEEKEEEENEEENMIRGNKEFQGTSDSGESKLIRHDTKAAPTMGGSRWRKISLTETNTAATPRPLPTDNPSRPLYPSTLLLGLLHSGAHEDGRVKGSLGRTLRGPLGDYYKVMKDQKESSTSSSSGTVVRVPRNVMDKKRKRRNKWKKKGKRGKKEIR